MLGDLKSTLGSMNHDGLGGSWARISGFMEHRRGEIPDVQPVLAPSMNKLPIFDKFFFGGGCSIILKVRLWGEGQDFVNLFSLEDLTTKVSISQATETQNVALL